ncbi:hypothetical protein BBK36DRAFT_1115131 [Trichoderma citrinoviride]|uniref:SAC3/GANP/THP3 conserved domain-containing protein n=1 Tax=Trichoderma citrinoviride TaxID=58853 RepID=A0A2T4BF31_9HYPO|nr:hypothetical protein BBK36DRAFT_1115131 [Trichoderma citrinoviride]PTB67947.1 hypothetical protein BBK36DRAFT_1115131 [Trichoderma citrinoviride]
MHATSVASSSQMFSPFSQKTQGSSQAFNPFAPRPAGEGASSFGSGGAGGSDSQKKSKRKNGFASGSDSERKPKAGNPFLAKDGNGSLSDSGRQGKKRGGDGEKKKLSEVKRTQKKERGEDSTSRPSSSSSVSSVDEIPATSMIRATDPYTKKVYDQLRKDGISPPAWPSQPGDPKSKAEMAKFREKYEDYRQKVRASLTKAALIDDPNERKSLQNAITFQGICEDMCSEYEKITRITELDVPQPERDSRTGVAKTSRMVKKLARSAAGQEAPLPMDVRSTAALRRTLDYLIDDLLRNDDNLPILHGFLWDRTRAIRRDFTFFSSPTTEDLKTQAYVLENIARFHVTALHLLSQPGKAGEDFVEQQELEQLGKALLSLRDLYDDCNAQGIACENEAEFRAYYVLFHAHDSNTVEMLQRQWKPHFWRDSDDIRTAVSLVEALQNTNDFHPPLKPAPSLAAANAFHSYFRIVEDPSVSYTMACFAECHFPQIRRSILRAVRRALARPKDTTNDVTAAALNKFLRFDTTQEAIDFAKLHGIESVPDAQAPMDVDRQLMVLNNKGPLLHPRLHHQFSQTLVEKKRQSRPLPDVIHKTVYENPTNSLPSAPSLKNEGSLFVGGSGPGTPAESPLMSSQKPAPLPAFGQPLSGFGSNLAGTPKAPEQTTSVFGAPEAPKSTTPFANPFASASTPTATAWGSAPTFGSTTPAYPSNNLPAAANPFASATTSSSTSEKPPTQPTLLGGGTASNPFATAAPAPSTTFQGFQGFQSKAPSQPQEVNGGTTPTTLPPPSAASAFSVPGPATAKPPAPAPAPQPASPPRDPLGEFTKWFVNGDSGLMREFEVFMVESIVRETYDKFQKDEAERKAREKEERDNAEAKRFRVYNLSLKYFYRWKKNAREKRLRHLRRSGRDQFRAFREAQRAAQIREEQENAQRIARQQAELAALNRPDELASIMRKNQRNKRKAAEDALLASGVLSGVSNERRAVSAIFRNDYRLSSPTPSSINGSQGVRSRSGSVASTEGGSKTRALRERLMGEKPGRFPRSLPSVSADSSPPEKARVSKVSERWRLKAMGIVQMPDGTALPESMVDEIKRGLRRDTSHRRDTSLRRDASLRRASITSAANDPFADSPLTINNKRKRSFGDEGESGETAKERGRGVEDDTDNMDSHKRVMSDADLLIQELRAMRQEMEEGTTWFKSQNGKLQSDILSRGGTPLLDESSII